jgi:ribosomal protein S18 acetylase RimI-like enzyme
MTIAHKKLSCNTLTVVDPVRLNRFLRYYKAHGLFKTFRRALKKLWLEIFRKPEIIYYEDLAELKTDDCRLAQNMLITTCNNIDEIPHEDMTCLCSYYGKKIIEHQMRERFAIEAKLWLLKIDEEVAGMVWSLKGKTFAPYFFLLGSNDVHLFNDEIFEGYRGRGLNTILIEKVLRELKTAGISRVFIDTNLRNKAEIKSLKKTSFKQLGLARKTHFAGWDLTIWSKAKIGLGGNSA